MPSDSRAEFFIDRSIGGHVVADALRGAGAVGRTMAEVYGERIGQGLDDIDWLREAGENGWVVLMKDRKIRYRTAELDALRASDVRAFCITNGNLTGVEMARRFVAQLPTIERIAIEEPGPYVYGVYADGIRPLWPK